MRCNNIYLFLNACMILQVVMFPLREFHNLAPYMEMHIDFVLVRKPVMQNESLCLVPYTDIYGFNFFCKLLGNSFIKRNNSCLELN